MARFVTGDADAEELLAVLTAQNAFVKRLPDGVTYRFHHMMKECAERTFRTLDAETQRRCRERYGAWYEGRGQYLHAMAAYRRCGDYDALLRVVQEDAGILLASLPPSEVLAALDECPADALKAHPFALLVLMRSMFNWRNIPRMLELKALLLAALEEHPELPAEERGNLLGECDLIMSFLCYNDISAMSRLHRSASAQMSRPAISIRSSGGWSFGSPSVLMMFYRAPGKLAGELAEMAECMPHYYKITNGHGQGAETIMRAEAAFVQGRFTDAHIALESSYAQIEGNGQENMALCCDFLAQRLSRYAEVGPHRSFAERRTELLRHHNASWLNLWNAVSAYCHALRGETELIPEVFAEHRLASVSILAPGRPMIEMIENQVYLAQGAYAKVTGRSEGLLALCEGMHYALVALHVRLQTASAYERLGKHGEAETLLAGAYRRRAGRHRDAVCGELPLSQAAACRRTADRAHGTGARAGRGRGAAAERDGPPRSVRRADGAGICAGRPDGTAADEPGDRGKAVSLRGQRQAICKPNLFQAPHRGRPAHEAQAARGAARA